MSDKLKNTIDTTKLLMEHIKNQIYDFPEYKNIKYIGYEWRYYGKDEYITPDGDVWLKKNPLETTQLLYLNSKNEYELEPELELKMKMEAKTYYIEFETIYNVSNSSNPSNPSK